MTRPLPPIAILAGGLATRMRPLTERIPKAMIEVAGEPFIAHQLRLLARNGLTDVVLLLGYRGEQIENYVRDGTQFGLNARYSYDGDIPLDTGGALRKALSLLAPMFFVLYGDSYLDISYRSVFEAFNARDADGLMTVLRNHDQFDRSNVVLSQRMVAAYSKTQTLPGMDYIDYGLSLLPRSEFEALPPGTAFGLDNIFQAIIRRERMAGFQVDKRFYEIGSPQGLAETEVYLRAANDIA